jgi:hypothetical protein
LKAGNSVGKESIMAKQSTINVGREFKVTAIATWTISSLCASPLEPVVSQIGHVLCTASGEVYRVLTSLAISLGEAAANYALDHAQLVHWLDASTSSWPLIRFIAGALLGS